MDVREQLVELQLKADLEDEISENTTQHREYIADLMIANGVTFAEDNNVPSKWISVKDRLPNRDDMVIAFYPTMRGTSGEMQIHKAWAMSETCTHWQYLPQPPKGE